MGKKRTATIPEQLTESQKAAMRSLIELVYAPSLNAQLSPTGQYMPSPVSGGPEPDDEYAEIGATGLRSYMGFIHEAYNSELNWPAVYPLYNRLRRSDPEMVVVRQAFTAMSRHCSMEWQLPDDPTDEEKRAQDFGYEVLDDFEGGTTGLLEQITAMVPFMGFGWWEVVPGLRDPNWVPPINLDPSIRNVQTQDEDTWRSQYDDGRIGIRRFGWRDHSSFWRWDFGSNMNLKGMIQRIPPGYPPPLFRTIPLDQSMLLRFGDTVNPEGLTPYEAVWRLERLKYGYEVVQGIGFEHSAGFLNVKKTEAGTISVADRANAKKAARAVMTAQEGNYAYWPYGIDAEVKDIPFQASQHLSEVIKYYGILKLQVYNMGWAAMSTTSSHGSLAAVEDASSMFMLTYNAMMEGFADQMDEQIGKRLYGWNSGEFPGITMRTGLLKSKSYKGSPTKEQGGAISPAIRRPKLTITSVDKVIDLQKLGVFWQTVVDTMPIGEEDQKAVRKLSGFMTENLPDPEAEGTTTPSQTKPTPQQIVVGNLPAGMGTNQGGQQPNTTMPVKDNEPAANEPSTAKLTHSVIRSLIEFSQKKKEKK